MKALLIFSLILTIAGCDTKKSAERYFTDVTGLEITQPIEIIRETNDFYAGAGEGEYALIFKANKKEITNWIAAKPPWKLTNWKKGWVDCKLGFHCSFGDPNGAVSCTKINGITKYGGNDEVIEILADTNNYYTYQERCCPERGDALRYHNGSLLIIKPETNTVYLSTWEW